MDLLPTELELQIVDAARRLLSARSGLAAVRAAGDSPDGRIPALWDEAVEQGWLVLAVPESAGGAGLSLVEQVLLFEELGRHLAPGPFLGSAAAAFALAGTEVGARVASGEPVALGLDTRGCEGVRAEGGRLSGHLPRVHHGVPGTPLLCDVAGELWWVEQVDYQQRRCVDSSVRLASTELAGAAGMATGVRTQVLGDALGVLAAAMAVGVADGALALALNYAKQREQFGKPIGSFQAVKHKIAESAVRVETARCLVAMAAAEWRDLGRTQSVAEARLLAAEYALENASASVLTHGAIGWTVECDAHLFVLRARYLHQFVTGPDELVNVIMGQAAEMA